jgi:aerobic carbon-monoxide dehydrogenase medium subunit
MMPLRRFTIDQPKSVKEAAEMLAHHGENGRLYAGGTELLLAMKHDLLRYEHLVDVKTVPDLNRISVGNGSLHIGATVTHRALEKSAEAREHCPVLVEMEHNVANVRVRATGTLGGNLCFAEPHSDPAALLLALEAHVHVQGKGGERTLPIDQLILGAYETALAPDELMTGIDVPLAAKNKRAAYLKFQIKERPTLGLALVMDADGGNIKSARAVVGSVSPKPARSDAVDKMLAGSRGEVEKRLADAAQALAEAADPVDDLEGSAEYKRHLIGVFLKRAFAKAMA